MNAVSTIGAHVYQRIIRSGFEKEGYRLLAAELELGQHVDRDGKRNRASAQVKLVRSHFNYMGFSNHQE